MKRKYFVQSGRKTVMFIVCMVLILCAMAGCKKAEKDTVDSEHSSSSASVVGDMEMGNGQSNTEAIEEPLPESMVITPFEDSPVSEINARWSREIRFPKVGEVVDFDNGDFLLIVDSEGRAIYGYDWPATLPLNQSLELIRYNRKGEILWQKAFNDLYADRVHVSYALSDHSLLLLTDIDFETMNEDSYYSNGLLTKITPEGEVAWSRKLTHNFEYFEEIFEMPNGDLYTVGSYRCESFAKKDDAKGRWYYSPYDGTGRVVLSRLDRNGKVMDYILPEHGFVNIGTDYAAASNDCNAEYKQGVGLIVNFGTNLVCYDENLREKWNYPFENVAVNDKQLEAGDLSPSTYFDFVEDSIQVWFTDNEGSNRIRTISFSGKLLSDKKVSGDELEETLHILPDGRQIVKDSVGKIKTRISFVQNGKRKKKIRFG